MSPARGWRRTARRVQPLLPAHKVQTSGQGPDTAAHPHTPRAGPSWASSGADSRAWGFSTLPGPATGPWHVPHHGLRAYVLPASVSPGQMGGSVRAMSNPEEARGRRPFTHECKPQRGSDAEHVLPGAPARMSGGLVPGRPRVTVWTPLRTEWCDRCPHAPLSLPLPKASPRRCPSA